MRIDDLPIPRTTATAISLRLDPSGMIDEDNEDNNTRTARLTPKETKPDKPDLIIQLLQYNQTQQRIEAICCLTNSTKTAVSVLFSI